MACNYSAPTPCIYSELADIILQDKFDNYGFENAGGGQGGEQKCVTNPEISLVPDGHGTSSGSGNVVHSSLQVEHKRQKSMGCLSSFSGGLPPDSMDSGDTTGHDERDAARRQKHQQKQKQKQRLSVDPQSIAARHRRHRISKKFKILQSMVPGGSKMDTASMLDEAIQYVKFLKMQIWLHDQLMTSLCSANGVGGAPSYGSGGRHGSAASEAFTQNAAKIPYSAYNSTAVGLVHANPGAAAAADAGSIESFSEISYGSTVRDRYHA